jgi:hypothetical protein
MRTANLLAIAAFAAAVGSTSIARAENPEITALRQGVEDLDARASAIRRRAERSPPLLRRESERIVAVVDNRRMSLTARIAILELLGRTGDADAPPLVEMKATLEAADRLLSIVERWYGVRR